MPEATKDTTEHVVRGPDYFAGRTAGRREAIEECIEHLRINGWFEAAETCLARRFKKELGLTHVG